MALAAVEQQVDVAGRFLLPETRRSNVVSSSNRIQTDLPPDLVPPLPLHHSALVLLAVHRPTVPSIVLASRTLILVVRSQPWAEVPESVRLPQEDPCGKATTCLHLHCHKCRESVLYLPWMDCFDASSCVSSRAASPSWSDPGNWKSIWCVRDEQMRMNLNRPNRRTGATEVGVSGTVN
jgi:hypothetical protein